jgi:hypothetical protein
MLDPNKIAGELRAFTGKCRSSHVTDWLGFEGLTEEALMSFFTEPQYSEIRDVYLKAFCSFGSFYKILTGLDPSDIQRLEGPLWKPFKDTCEFLDKFYSQLPTVGFILATRCVDNLPNRTAAVHKVLEVLSLNGHDLVLDMWGRRISRNCLQDIFPPESFDELRHIVKERVHTRMWDAEEPLVDLVNWFQHKHILMCNMRLGDIR